MDLQGAEGSGDAELRCRECAMPVAAPVFQRDGVKLKSSESRIPAMRKSDSAHAAASGGPGSSSWSKEKFRKPQTPATNQSLVPIVACLATVLVIVACYAFTRDGGKPKAPEAPVAVANVPLPAVQSEAPKDAPLPKSQSTVTPKATTPQVAKPVRSAPGPVPVPVTATPEPEVKPPAETAEAPKPPEPNPAVVAEVPAKTVEATTMESNKLPGTPDENEEEAIVTKAPTPRAEPKEPEQKTAQPVAPPKVEPDAAKRLAEFEQKLRKGEWVSLFTRTDQSYWDVDKTSAWKQEGESVAGSGKLGFKGLSLNNYELTLELSLQKGSYMSLGLRHDSEMGLRVAISPKGLEGQLYDYKQKKTKKTFEKIALDPKSYVKFRVQSKANWVRVTVNDKDVLMEYSDVPTDWKEGFYINVGSASKGAVKNVQFRPLF